MSKFVTNLLQRSEIKALKKELLDLEKNYHQKQCERDEYIKQCEEKHKKELHIKNDEIYKKTTELKYKEQEFQLKEERWKHHLDMLQQQLNDKIRMHAINRVVRIQFTYLSNVKPEHYCLK